MARDDRDKDEGTIRADGSACVFPEDAAEHEFRSHRDHQQVLKRMPRRDGRHVAGKEAHDRMQVIAEDRRKEKEEEGCGCSGHWFQGDIRAFTTNEKLIEAAVSLASGSLWMNKFDLLQESPMLKLYLQYLDEETGDSETKKNLEDWEKTTKRIYLLSEKERFEATVSGIFSAMNMIRALPGRKSLLFISNGLPDLSSFDTSDSALDVLGGKYGEKKIVTDRKHKLDTIHDKIALAGKFRIFDPLSIMEEKEFETGDEVINEIIRYANAQNISIYTLDAEMFSKYAATGPTAEHFRAEEAIDRDFVREEKIRQVQNLRKISEDTGAKIFREATKFDTLREVLNTDLNFYYLLCYYTCRVCCS